MNVQKIIHIIASGCRTCCDNYSNTMIYFAKNYKSEVDLQLVSDVASIINYNDLRLVEDKIFAATTNKGI